MFFKSNRKLVKGAAPLVLDVAPTPGFFAGTQVPTRYAWTEVEALRAGDHVLTAENGEQEILAVETGTLTVSSHAAAAAQWPLLVPEAALGNAKPMMVSPGMRLVVEDEVASTLFGQPCVSARAESLIGYRGIARARVARPLGHVTLRFHAPQTIATQGGLFFDVADAQGVHNFLPLDDRQARLLVRHLAQSDEAERSRVVSAGWI